METGKEGAEGRDEKKRNEKIKKSWRLKTRCKETGKTK